MWLDFLVAALSVGSLLLTFKYIYEVASLYNEKRVKGGRDRYKKAYRQQQEAYMEFRKRNRKYREELSSVHSVRDSEDSSMSNPPGRVQVRGEAGSRSMPSSQDETVQQLNMTVNTERVMEERDQLQRHFDLPKMVLWDDLTFYDKVKLFSIWSIFTLLSNVMQLFGSLQNIINAYNIFDSSDPNVQPGNGVEVLVGVGCMAAWIGLIKYMETSKHYSILARTLNLGMPNVLKTMISALPVLMGYTFLGLALFWKSNRFSSATGSLTTLYALMFGDMVYDTFHDLGQTNYLSSQLFLYSFVFFSVCVINSLFISVIVDAFETAKQPWKVS